PPIALGKLFSLVADKVNCVILNACYSESQGRKIAESIDYVIGMTSTISDKAAIKFSTGFYRALGNGEQEEKAFEFATLELLMEGIPEDNVPILITKEKTNTKKTDIIIDNPSTSDNDQRSVLEEKVKKILHSSGKILKSFRYGIGQMGMGGVGFGMRLDHAEIDKVVLQLDELNEREKLTDILTSMVGDPREDVYNSWKAIAILEKFRSTKALQSVKFLFTRTLPVESKTDNTPFLHESCLNYVTSINDSSLIITKKNVLQYAIENCQTQKTKKQALKELINLSDLNDDKIIEFLINLSDSGNNFEIRQQAVEELSNFNLYKYVVPIGKWLSSTNLKFRQVVASKLALKYYNNLEVDELSEIFLFETDRKQKYTLGQLTLKIDTVLGQRFITSLIYRGQEEDNLYTALDLIIKNNIPNAVSAVEKLENDFSLPQNIRNLVDSYLLKQRK
ncbi:MAG: hypothetical protein KDD15_31025, partial [Lewinella sp.]|nr:hypothetical protein [Lewinella sp.]